MDPTQRQQINDDDDDGVQHGNTRGKNRMIPRDRRELMSTCGDVSWCAWDPRGSHCGTHHTAQHQHERRDREAQLDLRRAITGKMKSNPT